MAGQRPRQGWIYMINPRRVVLKCSLGHERIYDISGPEELNCFSSLCTKKINSSRVMRGTHLHIVWSEYNYGKFHLYHAIPLTSKDTFRGLPTAYPIKANPRNGLSCNSLALVHQLTPIDLECFKGADSDWMKRTGVINADERSDIEERLRLALNLQNYPSEEWFTQNASLELLEKVFMLIAPSQQEDGISRLMDKLDC